MYIHMYVTDIPPFSLRKDNTGREENENIGSEEIPDSGG